jgi:hypothetical protein
VAETRTIVERFPKTGDSKFTTEQVDGIRTAILDSEAISCDKTEDDEAYILTTVWPVM